MTETDSTTSNVCSDATNSSNVCSQATKSNTVCSEATKSSNGSRVVSSKYSGWESVRKSVLEKVSAYVSALRPWSFSVSLTPVFLGCALAHKVQPINVVTVLLTALTALSVHAAGNVVNTYYDYIKGIDSKKSDDRTLVDKILSKDEIVTLGVMLYLIGCAGFVLLTMLSPARLDHLALVFFGGMSSSFMYTGGIGFKYIALGDVLIIIIFGPITVLFSFMVQTGQVQWATIIYAIPLALNAEAILHSNNTRDMECDRKAGIVTLAILLGRVASEVLFAFFLFTPYSIFVIWGLKYSFWLMLPLITISEAFKIEKNFRIDKNHIPKWTARLNFYFGFLYVFGCALTDNAKLPYSL
uniref:UbiA prenyltransferase domain-containing protein 1 homolog n=1 Tax=Hirondellea gigas TaxID=1518452 RepID=A0A2P2I974_9CRUS